jgi:hypothetical protein
MAHDAAAPANDQWLLRDANGQPVTCSCNANRVLGDLGLADYRDRWRSNASSFLAAHPEFDGVLVYDMEPGLSNFLAGPRPTAYPDDASWEAAMKGFADAVGPALRAEGRYVALEAYKGGSNDGSSVADWWRAIGPSASALEMGTWEQNPNQLDQLFDVDPCCWTGNWDGWLRLVDVAQGLGVDFLGQQGAVSTNAALLRYGRASFLLKWNGVGGAYLFSPTDMADPFAAEWTMDLGGPLAPMQAVGVAWRRDFSRGAVVVNPSGTQSQAVDLGGTFYQADGTALSSATLPPVSALLLRKEPL